MSKKNKTKSVSGGNIWKAIDLNFIAKRYTLLFILFCVGGLALMAAIVLNLPKMASTETYYVWNTPPILQSNTISFWVNFTLLSVGLLCLVIAIIILMLTPDPNAGSKIKYKSGDVFLSITVIIILLISFAGTTMIDETGRLQAGWIHKTYDVTVTDWKQIPPVRSEGQINVNATDKSGEEITLTLEFKNNKLYVINQEKIAEK